MLAIAAQIPSAEIGAGYFQETHPETLFRECSHYCELISGANQMPRTVAIAIRQCGHARRCGAAARAGRTGAERIGPPPAPGGRDARASGFDRPAALLNGEGRVTVLCGSGCQGAHDLLLTLGERLKAPMVHALRGKEHVEWENPYDVGMTGLIGFSSGYYAMLDCDVLLMLGTDFPYRQFYPEGGAV